MTLPFSIWDICTLYYHIIKLYRVIDLKEVVWNEYISSFVLFKILLIKIKIKKCRAKETTQNS